MQYLIYQQEKCPKTGRHHWQGYVRFNAATYITRVKEAIGGQPHVETCRGTEGDNIEYVTKEDSRIAGPWEFGRRGRDEMPVRGHRSDLQRLGEIVKQRGGLEQVIREHPGDFIKYHSGLTKLSYTSIIDRRAEDEPDVRLYIGPSGSGKTRSVYSEWRSDQIYQKDGSKWWDGYCGQEVILMDDWAGCSEVPPVELLKILDRYPHRVQTKGGYVKLGMAVIIITTMIHWSEWYGKKQEWLDQIIPFERRLKKIIQFPVLAEEKGAEGDAVAEEDSKVVHRLLPASPVGSFVGDGEGDLTGEGSGGDVGGPPESPTELGGGIVYRWSSAGISEGLGAGDEEGPTRPNSAAYEGGEGWMAFSE
jgi:hypothetical protein